MQGLFSFSMKFKIAILAAGKGTRMKSDLPKTLTPVGGKPILQHLYESILASGVTDKPIVVIGPDQPPLCEVFEGVSDYAIQHEQLGTGHAVACAREIVGDADTLIVLYGDHPFVSYKTLRRLSELHERAGEVMTIMTTTVPSFDEWRKTYVHWGRILRDQEGRIVGIKEYKDASDDEREIREVNPALYCFDTTWLWQHIKHIQNENANHEYYLTDLIALAVQQGHKIASMNIAPEEAVGINTPEEREIAEELLKKRNAMTDDSLCQD